MTHQPSEIRRINWSECFGFVQIFRTFRLAIHPSKLALALAGIVLMGLAGGVLDALWPSSCRPVADEVNAYWQVGDVDAWRRAADEQNAQKLEAVYAELAQPMSEKARTDRRIAVSEALEEIEARYEEINGDADDSPKQRKTIADRARYLESQRDLVLSTQPRGVFRSWLQYETAVVRQMIDAAVGLNFAGGLSDVVDARRQGRLGAGAPGGPASEILEALPAGFRQPLERAWSASGLQPVKSGSDGLGVLSCVFLMLRGFQWLIAEHLLFAVLFLLISLAIWSLFGGAIARMAAVNVAREERLSAKSALLFARRKFLGFFTAPLVPVGLILAIGLALAVGGLITAIPGVGEVLGGLGLGLALFGGFILALVIIGAVAGFGLMWPTIAVEGTDSFDAMSRSYSYVYSKPWHTVFYATVAAVYGSICYLFARFLVFLLLKTTRAFVAAGMSGAGLFSNYRPGVGTPGASKIDALWPAPTFDNLYVSRAPFGMEGAESFGSLLMSVWILIVVGLLCAFLASYFLTGSTVIYYLLRRGVDATDFEEVYLEEDEEEDLASVGQPSESADTAADVASGGGSADPSPPPSGDSGSAGGAEPSDSSETERQGGQQGEGI